MASQVLPDSTARHFCRLLVCDRQGTVCSIGSYIRSQSAPPTDSLTLEQLFTDYVFNHEGWQTLRIFPHATDGQVLWYAPADALPEDMDSEHHKYISEVFLRLKAEVQAGNWATVDAYIDRMLTYQTTFGAAAPPPPHSAQPWGLLAGLLVTILVLVSLSYIYK